MKKFITKKGTVMYWEIEYDLGGMNYFTSGVEPRGYSLHIQRDKSAFRAFTGIDEEKGASRLFLLEVKRRSKKQEAKAYAMVTESMLQEIADQYGV